MLPNPNRTLHWEEDRHTALLDIEGCDKARELLDKYGLREQIDDNFPSTQEERCAAVRRTLLPFIEAMPTTRFLQSLGGDSEGGKVYQTVPNTRLWRYAAASEYVLNATDIDLNSSLRNLEELSDPTYGRRQSRARQTHYRLTETESEELRQSTFSEATLMDARSQLNSYLRTHGGGDAADVLESIALTCTYDPVKKEFAEPSTELRKRLETSVKEVFRAEGTSYTLDAASAIVADVGLMLACGQVNGRWQEIIQTDGSWDAYLTRVIYRHMSQASLGGAWGQHVLFTTYGIADWRSAPELKEGVLRHGKTEISSQDGNIATGAKVYESPRRDPDPTETVELQLDIDEAASQSESKDYMSFHNAEENEEQANKQLGIVFQVSERVPTRERLLNFAAYDPGQLPKRDRDADLVIFLTAEQQAALKGGELPWIPGFHLSAMNDQAYYFTYDKHNDPYLNDDLVLDRDHWMQLSDEYERIGMMDLAADLRSGANVESRSYQFLSDLAGVHTIHSPLDDPAIAGVVQPVVSITSITDFAPFVDAGGYLRVECTGSAGFVRLSGGETFGKENIRGVGGFVLYPSSGAGITAAMHEQIEVNLNGRLYIVTSGTANSSRQRPDIKTDAPHATAVNYDVDSTALPRAVNDEVGVYLQETQPEPGFMLHPETIQTLHTVSSRTAARLAKSFNMSVSDLMEEAVRLPDDDLFRQTVFLIGGIQQWSANELASEAEKRPSTMSATSLRQEATTLIAQLEAILHHQESTFTHYQQDGLTYLLSGVQLSASDKRYVESGRAAMLRQFVQELCVIFG